MGASPRIRDLVRVALEASPNDPILFLKSLLSKKGADFANGRVEVSIGSSAGSVSYQVPPDMAPAQCMRLIGEAIDWLETQEDPTNPDLISPTVRVVVPSFRGAVPW